MRELLEDLVLCTKSENRAKVTHKLKKNGLVTNPMKQSGLDFVILYIYIECVYHRVCNGINIQIYP